MPGFSQNPCATDQIYQEQLNSNPLLKQAEAQFNSEAQKNRSFKKTTVIIIPVVFHVMHYNGNENISKEQIQDQIRILNYDFRRQNADTVKTRAIFRGIAADCEIEFRLATKDPQGNCSEGINRIETPLTLHAKDEIKYLSAWPSDRYYNIWVVQSINSGSNQSGTILGYAQFPWVGSARLDGVVIRHDYVGTIGTASSSNSKGRVLTHETGHWLGLYHTFQSGCASGDLVEDTPPVSGPNFNVCWPSEINSCTSDIDDLPDQYENYMDYSNGKCQNMFSLGQKARMLETLAGTRNKLITNANLLTTGVLNPVDVSSCIPKAYFSILGSNLVCEGTSIELKDVSYNYSGSITREWLFEGGIPATSTENNPKVKYSTPGWKKITLITSNSNGSDTFSQMNYVKIFPISVMENSFIQDFEVEKKEDLDWVFSASATKGWEIVAIPFSGKKSIFVENSEQSRGAVYYMSTNQVNITDGSQALNFHYSYTPRQIPREGFGPTITNDALAVYASTNCGANWIALWNSSGTNLMTTSGVPSLRELNFQPFTADLWKSRTASLAKIPSVDLKNVMFLFVFESDGGNNLYIDNIGLGTLSGSETLTKNNLKIYPNPANTVLNIELNSNMTGKSDIQILDMTGRVILKNDALGFPNALDISSVNKGMYLISVETETGAKVVKLFEIAR